jgi:hypothetical protein
MQNDVIYDRAAFAKIRLPEDVAQMIRDYEATGRFQPGQLVKVNRALLHAAYPHQILPASRPEALQIRGMENFWFANATRDLEEARRQYERN